MKYLAYGSNMSSARIRGRVPSAKFVTIAVLTHHCLRFHKKSKDGSGKCDAYHTGNPEDKVLGVVYEIDEGEKCCLDKCEGLGKGYNKKEVCLETIDNRRDRIRACTYCAEEKHIDKSLRPYTWYKHHVIIGARKHGLPENYIQHINEVEAIQDPDEKRHEREMRIYNQK